MNIVLLLQELGWITHFDSVQVCWNQRVVVHVPFQTHVAKREDVDYATSSVKT